MVSPRVLFVDIEGTLIEYRRRLGDFSVEEQFKGLAAFLEHVKSRGIKMVGITSAPGDLRTELQTAGVRPELLDEIHVSSQISSGNITQFILANKELNAHYTKLQSVERIIFESAVAKAMVIKDVMARLGIRKGNALMVGDRRDVDLQAARIAGIEHAASLRNKKYNSVPLSRRLGSNSKKSVSSGKKKPDKFRSLSPQPAGWDWSRQQAVKRFLSRRPK
ncbi:MAG: hypothetical protein HY917_01805 [Candidatus Diapherotrites archaeon]|nr:hypothetical protein [Candidatus Diapherotrites archaeon]